MSGSISTLMASGIDAFTNLWDIGITFPTALGDKDPNYSYSARAVDFNPPELSLMTSPVDYKAIQVTKPMPKITGDRMFTLNFRMDASFNLYKSLLAWKHIWVDPSGESVVLPGGMSGQDAKAYGTITVKAYNSGLATSSYSDSTPTTTTEFDSKTSVVAFWEFYDVICMKVGQPTFQRASSDFLQIGAEFIFGRYREPGSKVISFATTDKAALTP